MSEVVSIQRPKSVSEGSVLCWPTAATNSPGAIQQASTSSRMRHCETSRRTLFRKLDHIRRLLFDCITRRVAAGSS